MVPWHQEVVYYVPGSDFVQTWAPLIIDATIVNGTIQICPASHNEIAKQSYHEGEGDDYRYIVDEDVIKKYNPISLEMKLGQLLIFDSKLIHRSGKNESSQTRYSLVGINHNIVNEQFTPPRFVVKNRDKIMNDYYKELQPSEQDI
jgi:ectoine hydroxylase-related dioxygenase (phytanoyl-CoA dioxygenase family)